MASAARRTVGRVGEPLPGTVTNEPTLKRLRGDDPGAWSSRSSRAVCGADGSFHFQEPGFKEV
jgi:hypothetical protein